MDIRYLGKNVTDVKKLSTYTYICYLVSFTFNSSRFGLLCRSIYKFRHIFHELSAALDNNVLSRAHWHHRRSLICLLVLLLIVITFLKIFINNSVIGMNLRNKGTYVDTRYLLIRCLTDSTMQRLVIDKWFKFR